MERGEHESQDPRAARSTRRDIPPNERLAQEAPAYGEPINPNWRSERATGRGRRARAVPSSRQEFLLWLQYGGWKILAAAGVVAALMIVFIILSMTGSSRPLPLDGTEDSGAGQSQPQMTLDQQATVTPAPALPAELPTQPTTGAQFRVFNTGAEGLFLRPDPSTGNQPLTTVPDGSIVTVIGEDFVGLDRVWKHVRAPDGTEGWVASDWLQPAQ